MLLAHWLELKLVISAYDSDLGEGRGITQGSFHLLIGVAFLLRSNDWKLVRTQGRFYLQPSLKRLHVSLLHLISEMIRIYSISRVFI